MTSDRDRQLAAAHAGREAGGESESGSDSASDSASGTPMLRRHGAFTWEAVPVHPYKSDGTAPFKDITRQILFSGPEHAGELRYFEVAAGGYSTLERHAHVHGVMILRGSGQALVGEEVRDVGQHDLVHVPPMAWHQFRANRGEPLGFLCMVNADRDRPQLPTDAERDALAATFPEIARFLAED